MGASVRPVDPFDEALQATRRQAADPFDQALAVTRQQSGPDRLPRLRADRLAPPPAPSGVKQGLLARTVNAVGGMADNPIGTAAGIVTAPIHTLKTAGGFLGQTAAELTLPADLQNLAYQDPSRITEREGAFSAAQLATLGAARFVPKPAMVPFGAAAGAAFSPDDPGVGAVLGAAGIAVPKTIAGAYARSASGKAAAAEAATTAARRQRNALGETPIGPTRRIPKEEVTPDRLDRISYRPDPLAEHVVQPEAPRVPIAPESFPLGTTAEGSGPMFRLRKTAFATGQGIRRPKGTTPEPTPAAPTPLQAAFEQAKAQEAAPTPRRRRSDPVPAFEELSAGQQAVVEGVRSRPLGAAEPIVPTAAELAKVEQIMGRRSTDTKPVAAEPPPVIGEPVSAGVDLNAPPRTPLTPVARARPPKGVEPEGMIAREGTVSAGPEKPPLPGTPPAEQSPLVTVAPDPVTAPRDYLNFAKFGLDKATEARLRDNVAELHAAGAVDKGYASFAEQRAQANKFARDLVANPLQIDQAKLKNLSGAQIVGLRRVVGENTKTMEGLSKAIESGQLSPDEIKTASDMLDRAATSTNEALSTIVRETAQTARDLGFLRQMAKLSTDPEVWIVRAKKMLGDRVMPDKVMIEIRRLAREAADACS